MCYFWRIHERGSLASELILFTSGKNEPLIRIWLKYQAEKVLIISNQSIKFQSVGSYYTKVLMCRFLMCLRETQAGTAGVNSRVKGNFYKDVENTSVQNMKKQRNDRGDHQVQSKSITMSHPTQKWHGDMK